MSRAIVGPLDDRGAANADSTLDTILGMPCRRLGVFAIVYLEFLSQWNRRLHGFYRFLMGQASEKHWWAVNMEYRIYVAVRAKD